jgi:hypothetical protein
MQARSAAIHQRILQQQSQVRKDMEQARARRHRGY